MKAGLFIFWAATFLLIELSFGRVPLKPSLSKTHDLTIKPLGQGEYEITTTGRDPYLITEPFSGDLDLKELPVLSFETFSLKPIKGFQVFLSPPTSERHSLKGETINSSEGWTPYTIELSQSPHWQKGKHQLRLDFGRAAGVTFQLRSLKLRPFTPAELKQKQEEAAKAEAQLQKERWWESYLKAPFQDQIEKVVVTRDSVSINYQTSRPLLLGEIKPWQSLQHIRSREELNWSQEIGKGPGQTTVKRFEPRSTDRLHSRWALFKVNGDALELASHASYCTDQSAAALTTIPVPQPKTKKGLPFTWRPGAMDQLDELGIKHGTINIDLCQLLRLGKDRPFLTHTYLGQEFRINKAVVDHLSRSLRFAAERQCLMGAILLVSRNPPPELRNTLIHPDYLSNGIYSMANLTTPEACLHYGMLIDFLASYFSTKEYGFIHYWIVHNEVDAAWVWTNCGKCGPHSMMDSYVKSMRMIYQIARQYHPKATAHISLTHFWNKKNVHGPAETMYAPRDLLEILNNHGQTEGDFEWAVAYHPYPVNLRNPRVWDDQVDRDFDTDIISYKNIEVLPAYLRQERFLYQGKIRKIRLTEQGLSNPDDSPEQLKVQAAALAYAMKKVNATDGIDAHILHRWVDHAKEGGLNLGIVQKKPGSICTAGRKKPSFEVYKAIDTPTEEEVCRFALEVIGIPSWEHISPPIPAKTPATPEKTR